MTRFPSLTREAALDQLATIIPQTGRAYASGRNTDFGPNRRPTTTALSPCLRRRLLLEEEVVVAALDAHGPEEVGKFVEEVFWRSYFKGHLETRPAIWTRYKGGEEIRKARDTPPPSSTTSMAAGSGIIAHRSSTGTPCPI